MVKNAREVCGSIRIGGNNPNSMWWNAKLKAEVRDEEEKKDVWKFTKKKKEQLKDFISEQEEDN